MWRRLLSGGTARKNLQLGGLTTYGRWSVTSLHWRGEQPPSRANCASGGRYSGPKSMTEPDVTKEYREDLGERDADGFYDYAYRYWVYWFDFDGRRYRARIYTDDQTDASVMHIGSGRAATYDDDLRAIVGLC